VAFEETAKYTRQKLVAVHSWCIWCVHVASDGCKPSDASDAPERCITGAEPEAGGGNSFLALLAITDGDCIAGATTLFI